MDSTARSSEDLKSKPEGYVLSDMIADACAVVGTVVTNKELTFDIEVSPSIPKRLIGDKQYDAHAIDAGHEELESVALLLLHMESELKIVNDPGEGLELYFEIEQQIPNSPVDGSNDEA